MMDNNSSSGDGDGVAVAGRWGATEASAMDAAAVAYDECLWLRADGRYTWTCDGDGEALMRNYGTWSYDRHSSALVLVEDDTMRTERLPVVVESGQVTSVISGDRALRSRGY
ncbi:hypothetical protein Pelo_9005 [Pelomyxa schiedti]|nr:hypothetical protein Pelo_9005 [Pelomyxa schiedti]